MLARPLRLRRATDFSVAVRRGDRAGTSLLVIHLLSPEPELDSAAPARCGFVVGKSVGDAVTRNRVLRRLRHLVRPRLAQLGDGSMLVVRALPATAGASTTELAVALDRCLRRAEDRGRA